jgi:glycosyltransferase involved in cell wall biosynthesis
MKKRLAIFMHGGISSGISSQGFPKIVQIVEGLSDEFEVSVFSLASVGDNFKPKKYSVYAPPAKYKSKLVRWIYFLIIFLNQYLKKRYDLLYSFWGYPMGFLVVIIGKIFRRPSFINILGAETANVPEINYGHLRSPLTRRLVLWTCKNASQLIAVSKYQVDILNRYGLNRFSHVVTFGVDRKLFYPLFKKIELPLKIIHVANLTEVKDQFSLIRTFQTIRNQLPAQLKIVGPDFLNGQIQSFVNDSGLSNDVEFVGSVMHTNLIKHYHWADVFILTSLSEGQNNSITEAMACGVLPVSTAVGSMDKDFGNEVGIVADCKDYKALGNGVVALYYQPEIWGRKRQAAAHWAQTYDLTWTIDRLKTILINGK